jgi:hypothetical protein
MGGPLFQEPKQTVMSIVLANKRVYRYAVNLLGHSPRFLARQEEAVNKTRKNSDCSRSFILAAKSLISKELLSKLLAYVRPTPNTGLRKRQQRICMALLPLTPG